MSGGIPEATAVRDGCIIHHFLCAYVGPDADFEPRGIRLHCPKCNRFLREDGSDWELISGKPAETANST